MANPAPWTTGSIQPLFVEGYAAQLSYVAGDAVGLHVSTSCPTFSITIERIGVAREEVLTEAGLPVRFRRSFPALPHHLQLPFGA